MRFTFTPIRIICFLGLLGLFGLLGGFSFPDVDFQGRHTMETAMDSWITMILTFAAGAAAMCLVDQDFCLFSPVSLRPFYIILGLLAMAAAIAWLFYIQGSWETVPG